MLLTFQFLFLFTVKRLHYLCNVDDRPDFLENMRCLSVVVQNSSQFEYSIFELNPRPRQTSKICSIRILNGYQILICLEHIFLKHETCVIFTSFYSNCSNLMFYRNLSSLEDYQPYKVPPKFLTFHQVSYLTFERQSSSIAAVGIANGMMVSCNKLRSGFDNVGSVTGTFYPPVASPHDQTLHYSSPQSSKGGNYSMQSNVESNYNHQINCGNRQQSVGLRSANDQCPSEFLNIHSKYQFI